MIIYCAYNHNINIVVIYYWDITKKQKSKIRLMSAIVTSEDSFDKSIKTETVQSFNKSKKIFKVRNGNTRTTATGVFVVNFEHSSQFFRMFLLLTLNN